MPMIWYSREAAEALVDFIRTASRWLRSAVWHVKNAIGWVAIVLIVLVSLVAIVLLVLSKD